MIYRFEFDALPPNHNDWDRMHWTKRKIFKDQWLVYMQQFRNETAWFPEDMLPLKECGVVWRMFVGRRRDWDNCGGMLKPVLDGMKTAELVVNDSPVCILWLDHEQFFKEKEREEYSQMEIWTREHMHAVLELKQTLRKEALAATNMPHAYRVGKWTQPVLDFAKR